MTSERSPFPDYYEVLGVDPDVSDEELRDARMEAVKRWHPDRNSEPGADEMMRLVNHAWDVLGEPASRAEYDAQYFAWIRGEQVRGAATADDGRRENGYGDQHQPHDRRGDGVNRTRSANTSTNNEGCAVNWCFVRIVAISVFIVLTAIGERCA